MAKSDLSPRHQKILQALKASEPVVYSENGNRSKTPAQTLKKMLPLLPRLGVTRVADISGLSPLHMPVMQTTRPGLYGHTKMGQNSGAQGKGWTKNQALISCCMETLESVCMEPRSTGLIRNSFDFLKKAHLVVDPKLFLPNANGTLPSQSEMLMWTPAIDLNLETTVLVPAESCYFPFPAKKFKTRALFHQGSNGVAAGATYLEATLHALYELIERHYIYLLFRNELQVTKLEFETWPTAIQSKLKSALNEYQIEVFQLSHPHQKPNLPMIFAALNDGENIYFGQGCASEMELALSRALSECWQAMATFFSGAREDQSPTAHADRKIKSDLIVLWQSFFRPQATHQRSRNVINKKFKNLRSEYLFLRQWLQKWGAFEIYLHDLSHDEIALPVVRVIVPELKLPDLFTKEISWNAQAPEFYQFNGLVT